MKITMSHNQAAWKIKEWYLFRHGVVEAGVKGTEVFTLFDKMSPDKQDLVIQKLHLNPFEKPVLIFAPDTGKYIINTSQRFVKITDAKHESVYYDEFQGFIYYEALHYEKEKRYKATPTVYIDLGLKKISGEILFWEVPQDNAGFFFWNVTRSTEDIRIMP